MADSRIRLAGTYCGIGYGLLLLCAGIAGANFDLGRRGFTWTSVIVFGPALTIIFSGLGAKENQRWWPWAALAGSLSILAIATHIGKGNPFTLFSMPALIWIIALAGPALVATVAIAALISRAAR